MPFTERRRLSECVEEDESEAEEDQRRIQKDIDVETTNNNSNKSPIRTLNGDALDHLPLPQSSSTNDGSVVENLEETEVIEEEIQTRRHKFVVTKASSISPQIEKELNKLTEKQNSKTVHFPCTAPTRPVARSIFGPLSPHLDKRFFDSSLVEIRQKNFGDSAGTLDGWKSDQDVAVMDDVWIKRDQVGFFF